MNKKSVSIQILRIIATIGVFNGHFLGLTLNSKESLEFLSFLRNGWVSRTAFCVLYQGDTNVKLFLVISGFLFVFSMKKHNGRLRKLFDRYAELVVPGVIISILCALSWKIQECIGNDLVTYNRRELLKDIYKIMLGGGIPYYSYQLWFINSLVRCIILATLFYVIVRNEKMRGYFYLVVLVILGIKSEAYFPFFCGMFVAEIVEKKNALLYKRKTVFWVIISLVCVIVFPFTFNEDNLSIYNANMLSICFSILILGLINIENRYAKRMGKEIRGIINFFDRNAFSFYILHVLIQKTFSNNFFVWSIRYLPNEKIVILLDWIITIILLCGLSDLFTKHVLKNINILIKKVWI